MSVSAFGKELRHIRIDKDWRLYDMAEKLGVSSAYLSAVELGNKPVSDDLLKNVKSLVEVDSELSKRLEVAAMDSLKQVSIRVKERSEGDKSLVLAFARRLDSLSVEQKRKIFEELNSGESET